MNILFLGLPGSGKGTISTMLKKNYNYEHFSTGDLFRYNIKNKTILGIKAIGYINAGKYVPDELTIEMVKDFIIKNNLYDNLIYDGFPRTVEQAKFLDHFLNENNKALNKIIYLDIDKNIVKKRISNRIVCSTCGRIYNKVELKPIIENICDDDGGKLITRVDDMPENVEERFKVYEKETMPLINYYDKRVIKINIEEDSKENILLKIDKVLKGQNVNN